jgi:2-polyprenyl-3-methyl-5-hydroxy-6-metoxy-1,4-benzoquinol methylase
LEARAKSQKLTIGIEKSDASEHRLKQQYDALICMRLLHFLKIADGWSIIKNMQNNTNE